jgi:hypothetical protein
MFDAEENFRFSASKFPQKIFLGHAKNFHFSRLWNSALQTSKIQSIFESRRNFVEVSGNQKSLIFESC